MFLRAGPEMAWPYCCMPDLDHGQLEDRAALGKVERLRLEFRGARRRTDDDIAIDIVVIPIKLEKIRQELDVSGPPK
jgi:hypothetical protein